MAGRLLPSHLSLNLILVSFKSPPTLCCISSHTQTHTHKGVQADAKQRQPAIMRWHTQTPPTEPRIQNTHFIWVQQHLLTLHNVLAEHNALHTRVQRHKSSDKDRSSASSSSLVGGLSLLFHSPTLHLCLFHHVCSTSMFSVTALPPG